MDEVTLGPRGVDWCRHGTIVTANGCRKCELEAANDKLTNDLKASRGELAEAVGLLRELDGSELTPHGYFRIQAFLAKVSR